MIEKVTDPFSFIKNSPRIAGRIFILSGVSALIVMSMRIANILFLFTESYIGMILVLTPLVFIIIGISALMRS
ncbi:hypothetical protein KKC45_01230 [Patescibacteria group bacterium]|nr:hypothetical protein [Patescibacteria group bacterium]